MESLLSFFLISLMVTTHSEKPFTKLLSEQKYHILCKTIFWVYYLKFIYFLEYQTINIISFLKLLFIAI